MTLRSRRVDIPAEIARGTAIARPVAPMVGRVDVGVELVDDAFREEIRTDLEALFRDGEPDETAHIVSVYMTKHDDDVRPHHAALHGTVWDVDDPSRPIPPLGHGCRCWEELRAADEHAAIATGLPMAPERPPKPGADALRRFFDGAKTATGEPVTPEDILGQTVGRAVDTGKLPWKWALDDGGNAQKATIVKGLVANKTTAGRLAVERSMYRLQGLGITVGQSRGIAAAARELVAAQGLTDREALIAVLIEQRPGFIPARTADATRRRAERAADYILTMLGGAL